SDLRWRVVYLNSKGYSNKDITMLLFISKASVCRILSMFQKWGYIKNLFKGQPKCKKTFTCEELGLLKRIIKEKVDLYLDELAVEIKNYTQKQVSVSTIWQSLQYCGISHKKVIKINKKPDCYEK
ncbi:32431_t:CDS:1, partial [Racocetra persica]